MQNDMKRVEFNGSKAFEIAERKKIILGRNFFLSVALLSSLCLIGCEKKEGQQLSQQSERQVEIKRRKPLSLLLFNAEKFFDTFIYNVVTTDQKFIYKGFIQEGVKFADIMFPEYVFMFKKTGLRSNALLPKKIRWDKGKNLDYTTSIADAINRLTRLKAKDVEEIRNFLIQNYVISFGIELDRNAIKVVGNGDGSVADIKYYGQNKGEKIKVKIAKKISNDEEREDITYLQVVEINHCALTNKNSSLVFPASIYVEHSFLIPESYLKDIIYGEIAQKYILYNYKNREISIKSEEQIKMTIDIDDLIKIQHSLEGPIAFEIGRVEDTVIEMANLNHFITIDDFVKQLADLITKNSRTKEEAAQDLLSFVQSLNHFKDIGETPRFIHSTLLGKGGDCEDTAIAYATLLKAKEIDCIFIYYDNGNYGHAGVGIAGNFSGEAIKWNRKEYFIAETTFPHEIGRIESMEPLGEIGYIQQVGKNKLIKVE